MPVEDVAGWLDRLREGAVAEHDIPGWAAAGITGDTYLKYGLATMTLKRFLPWHSTGLPPRHIRAYEDAGVPPKVVKGHGAALGLASDPVEYVLPNLGYGPNAHRYPEEPKKLPNGCSTTRRSGGEQAAPRQGSQRVVSPRHRW
ncbi:hypothetical protein [Micromonospora sp. NPDC049301]|uniref:hypothetical protein n=1 Tax=Micromonospora sp. NPDC049301 TaxID=3155723 RepID=UPI00341D3A92